MPAFPVMRDRMRVQLAASESYAACTHAASASCAASRARRAEFVANGNASAINSNWRRSWPEIFTWLQPPANALDKQATRFAWFAVTNSNNMHSLSKAAVWKKKKKKRQNPSVGKYVRMRITAKAGETYNILETGKCNLGLWIELICRESFPICSWATLLKCYMVWKHIHMDSGNSNLLSLFLLSLLCLEILRLTGRRIPKITNMAESLNHFK